MRAARARAKPDANQAKLVAYLRNHGASVQLVHSIPGALDLVIGYRGIDQRVEIKDPAQPPNKRRLSDAERDVFEAWRGRLPVIVETIADCETLLAVMARDSADLRYSRRDQDLGAPNTGLKKSR